MFIFLLILIVNADYSKWMSFINDDVSINHIVIPGTHESLLNNLAPVSGMKYVTQELSIDEQLTSGVRFFDVHVLEWDSDLIINYENYYSMYTYNLLFDILMHFLNMNPTEFVILRVTGEPYNVISTSMIQHSEYYYVYNDIPKIKDVRKKVYVVYNNDLITYDNDTISDCYTHTLQQRLIEIQSNIIMHNNLHVVFSSGHNEECSYKFVASIINPQLQSYINTVQLKLSGVIATDFMTTGLSYNIFTKNDLKVNMYYEYIITIVITGFVYTICCFIFIFTKQRIYINVFISCMSTSVHIIWICYYYYMATYINYNSMISAYVYIFILVVLICSSEIFNLLLLCPQIFEMENYVYKTHYIFNFKATLANCILLILTLYGNCNYLFRISYAKIDSTVSIFYICKEHKVCYFVILFLQCCIVVWDVSMFFCMDYIFIKSSILILCSLILILNIIFSAYHYYSLTTQFYVSESNSV